MFLAAEAAEKASRFTGFDVFVILFTIVIAFGVLKSIKSPERNMFAIGFGVVCLIVFLFVDALMVANWFGILGGS